MGVKMQKIIFVVDDNDINLTIAKEVLKDHYRVMTMPSAAKMFTLLEKITPDLILLDIEMPEMNGFEALRQLKDNSAFAGIPVIFLTGTIDNPEKGSDTEPEVVDVIKKPFSAHDILDRIKVHVGTE